MINFVWGSKTTFFKTKSKPCQKPKKFIYRFHTNVKRHLGLSILSHQKKFDLSKQWDIIVNSMSQTREKWDCLVLRRSDFWMIWRFHGIPCFHFYFLFRTNGKREQLHENDFRHCYGDFLPFWKFLITAMFKVLPQQSRGTSTTAFERHLTVEDFTNMDQHRW